MTIGVLYFSLVLTRVAAFVAALPVFGGLNTPRLVKATLALALTVMWFGAIYNSMTLREFVDRPVPTPLLLYGIAVLREAILGAFMGFVFGLFLVPARVAGEYLTQEMGLTFGNLVSSTGGTPIGSLTQIFEMLTILLFFGIDGHHLFFVVMNGTFAQIPIGAPLPPLPMEYMVRGSAQTMEWGIVSIAPVGFCLFLATVVLVLMVRAAPQLNLYSVGFPLRLGIGLAGILVLAPNIVSAIVGLLGRFSEYLQRLV